MPAEDALGLVAGTRTGAGGIKVVVLAYPRISNFDDFDPLRLEPALDVVFLRPGSPLPGDAKLVILRGPRQRSPISQRCARQAGTSISKRMCGRGGHVLGVCGGYQMLGRVVADPLGIEGPPSSVEGLGLLDVETVMGTDKTLVEVTGETVADRVPFRGYEMHVGRTSGPDCARPLVRFATV